MTRSCVVFGCNSNNRIKVPDGDKGVYVRGEYVTCFSWPKDEDLKQRWLDALPNQKGSVLTSQYNGVCIKHFRDIDVDSSKKFKYPKPGAVPCIFEGSNATVG